MTSHVSSALWTLTLFKQIERQIMPTILILPDPPTDFQTFLRPCQLEWPYLRPSKLGICAEINVSKETKFKKWCSNMCLFSQLFSGLIQLSKYLSIITYSYHRVMVLFLPKVMYCIYNLYKIICLHSTTTSIYVVLLGIQNTSNWEVRSFKQYLGRL